MSPEKKQQRINDLFTLILVLGILTFIIRAWPILFFLLLGLIAYAFKKLFSVDQQPTQLPAEPPLCLPEAKTEDIILRNAFGLLQQRVTAAVIMEYPDARWIWSRSDAFKQFAEGRTLTILLNRAGGYQEASVQVRNLLFAGLVYMHAPEPQRESDDAAPGETEEETSEEEPVNYDVLAFEWVEANLQHLSSLQNQATGAERDEFLVPAEELPHGDSWPALCKELLHSGFSSATPVANGISIKLKKEK